MMDLVRFRDTVAARFPDKVTDLRLRQLVESIAGRLQQVTPLGLRAHQILFRPRSFHEHGKLFNQL